MSNKCRNTNIIINNNEKAIERSEKELLIGDFFRIQGCNYWFVCVENGTVHKAVQIGGARMLLDEDVVTSPDRENLTIAKEVEINVKY